MFANFVAAPSSICRVRAIGRAAKLVLPGFVSRLGIPPGKTHNSGRPSGRPVFLAAIDGGPDQGVGLIAVPVGGGRHAADLAAMAVVQNRQRQTERTNKVEA